jgi:tRNA-specific 2-thiouridylase
LRDLGNGSYEINAEEMIQGVAPGQFCVIYDDEHHKCYGSGEIAVM